MKIVTRGVVAVALGLVALSFDQKPATPEPEVDTVDAPMIGGVTAEELADCLISAA